MKGGMMVLLKVGEGINSVWENDRLWKILKVNKICFHLMWWGDVSWGEKKKDCFEWWAREVVTQWKSEGNREGWICFIKERCCHQDRRAWTGAEDSVSEKKGCFRGNRGGMNVSYRLRLWRRGERRKGCRWHWLGLKEVLSLFSVTNSFLPGTEMYCLSSNLQLPSPGVSPSTSWEILSGMVDPEQLGRIVRPPLPREAVLSYVNTLSCSQMSPGNKYWLL